MTIYIEDFNDYTVGNDLDTESSGDWVNQIGGNHDFEIVSDTDLEGGQGADHDHGGSSAPGHSVFEWNSIGSIDSADGTIEILVQFKVVDGALSADGVASGVSIFSFFTDGLSGTTEAYTYLFEGNPDERVAIGERSTSGSYSNRIDYDDSGTYTPNTTNNGAWWVRLQMDGDGNFKARTWQDGDAEPGTWFLEGTDTTLTSGYVGIPVVTHSTEHDVRYGYIAVGTAGDSPSVPGAGGAATYPPPTRKFLHNLIR